MYLRHNNSPSKLSNHQYLDLRAQHMVWNYRILLPTFLCSFIVKFLYYCPLVQQYFIFSLNRFMNLDFLRLSFSMFRTFTGMIFSGHHCASFVNFLFCWISLCHFRVCEVIQRPFTVLTINFSLMHSHSLQKAILVILIFR